MKIEHVGYLIAIVMGLGGLTACTGNHSESTGKGGAQSDSMAQLSVDAPSHATVPTDAPTRNAQDGLWIAVPADLRFPNVKSVETAPSWAARVAKLPERDQAYLAGVSERYFGTLEFKEEDEQRELVKQGFPMPEEWLAAQNLPMEELERLVEQGNVKAKMFYVDRMSEEIGPILSRGEGLDPTTPDGRVQAQRVIRARLLADELLQQTSSPFAAYLAGRVATSMTFETPPGQFAGSFQLARDRGHSRAGEFQGRYFAAHPGMTAAAVMSSYSTLKQVQAVGR